MKRERLFSLDLLRGLDMFLLVVVGPLFAALDRTFGLPESVMAQFHHNWGGFTLWDLIMPLFIFMCGAAVPFALKKRLADGPVAYWRHVLARVALLWVLGMIAQGRLLSMDASLINPFNNTLQAIAAGYLVAAAVQCIPSPRIRLAVPIALALAYAAALHILGDYTADGNAATRFEYWLLPHITPAGSKALSLADPGYSWWATIPMFGAMTLCGAAATEMLSSEKPARRKCTGVALVGAVLLAAGWALSPWIPAIKHIYTLTFTAQAMGWCMLLLAALYLLTDILKFRSGLWLFILFGQTSLMAYMCHEFKPVLRAFANMFTPGVKHLLGEGAAPLSTWFFSSLLLVSVLYLWRARRKA